MCRIKAFLQSLPRLRTFQEVDLEINDVLLKGADSGEVHTRTSRLSSCGHDMLCERLDQRHMAWAMSVVAKEVCFDTRAVEKPPEAGQPELYLLVLGRKRWHSDEHKAFCAIFGPQSNA